MEESGGGEAGEEGPGEEPAAPAAPAEAEPEQEEEEGAEPREGEGEGEGEEGEGEWQQIAVPMLPPGVLAGMQVGRKGWREREGGGRVEREGRRELWPFRSSGYVTCYTSLSQMGPKLVYPLHWSPFS